MAQWDLAEIRQKVRNVSGRLSVDEMSNDEIVEYINRYVQYEFPAEVKLDRNYSYYEFNTVANQATYTVSEDYTNFDPKAYIDNIDLAFYSEPDKFEANNPYNITRVQPWAPFSTSISGFTNANPGVISVASTTGLVAGNTITVTEVTETGGGTSLNGTYTIASVTSNTITVTTDTSAYATYSSGGIVSLNITGYSTTLTGIPIRSGTVIVEDGVEVFTDNGSGTLTGDQGGTGSINYLTGVLSVTFNTAPVTGVDINVSYEQYQAGRPRAVLLFNNQFELYPIPDKVYRFRCKGWSIQTVTSTAGVLASSFSNPSDRPLKDQWGPAIAYGAARRIHSDYGEMDAYAEVTALYKEQINYVLKRTHNQLLVSRSQPMF
jgi:hypothetical protein